MSVPGEFALAILLLLVVLFTLVGVIVYQFHYKPRLLRRRAAKELPELNDPGLEQSRSPNPKVIGAPAGSGPDNYRSVRELAPDEQEAHCVELMADALAGTVQQHPERIQVDGTVAGRKARVILYRGLGALSFVVKLHRSVGRFTIEYGPCEQSSQHPLTDDVRVGWDGRDAALALLAEFSGDEMTQLVTLVREAMVGQLEFLETTMAATFRVPVQHLDRRSVPEYFNQLVAILSIVEQHTPPVSP